MKPSLIFFAFLLLLLKSGAQQPSSLPVDSLAKIDTIRSAVDTASADTVKVKDSLPLIKPLSSYQQAMQWVMANHSLLKGKAAPVAYVTQPRQVHSKDLAFYILFFLVGFLGLLRFIYARYFDNLFRVFFNTSLRQNQLTDQLLQAKLPSLLFNVLFVFSAGLFFYFLLRHFHFFGMPLNLLLMAICVAGVTVIYFGKFALLSFTGWLTGYQSTTNTYVFVIFLINKIMAVMLLPFSIVLIFSEGTLLDVAAYGGIMLVAFLLILRFFRSYGLLQQQLSISRPHFFLYLIGVEILPLFLIYKTVLLLLGKTA